MPIPLILAGAAALGAGAKIFRGIKQGNQADEIRRNNKRPTRFTQQELVDNADLAAFRAANAKLPGANTAEIKANAALTGVVNAGVNTQRDPASIAALLAAGDKNYNNTLVDLTDKGAAFQNSLTNTMYQQKGILAQDKQMNWDWNEKQKYLNAMAAASALNNASNENIDSAVQDVAGIGVSYGMNKAFGAGGGSDGKSYPINTPGVAPNTNGTLAGGVPGMGGNVYRGMGRMQEQIMEWRQLNKDYSTPDYEIVPKLSTKQY